MHHPSEYFAAILTRPHEDTPRLRYASWLEARIDPLGEFIRLQCALARNESASVVDPTLEARQFALWSRHHAVWSRSMHEFVRWASFRRGFIEEVALSTCQLRAHADVLFQRAPLQELHLELAETSLDDLPSVDQLEQTLFLDLSAQPLGDAGAAALAQAPFLTHVHGLNLSSCGIGDAGLRALGESPYLGQLRELYLCENGISNVGVRHFALSPVPEQLDLLYLRANPISDEAATLLTRILDKGLRVDRYLYA